MLLSGRHNSFLSFCLRLLAYACALAGLWLPVFKPLHLIGDLKEAQARTALAATSSAANTGTNLQAMPPADPPCMICAMLARTSIPAAVILCVCLCPPVLVSRRFAAFSLRFPPYLSVSRTSPRAPPALPQTLSIA